MSVHIGEEIERRRTATGMSKTRLAELLGCDRSHVYTIIASPTLDSGLIKLASRALSFNFFKLLAEDLEEGSISLGPSGSLSEPAAVYGRRPAERSTLRVVIEVDPSDAAAQAAALRMAQDMQRTNPAPDRDKER